MLPKILVVDDESHTRDALKRTLNKEFEVLLAANATEALKTLETQPEICIVLSDEQMPGMRGVELLSEVKIKYPQIIRVMLSGQIELEGMMRAINQAQVHRFIMKPWDNDTLRLQLQEALLHYLDLEKSVKDPVTGLTNHRYFQEKIRREIDRAERHKRIFSLLMIDVDYFKAYNDKFGHPAGDKALNQIAQHLNKATRTADSISRYGGEEFAMVLPETNKSTAMEVAQRIRHEMEQTKIDTQNNHVFTLSIGVSCYPIDGTSAEELIEKADKALYMAKKKGRNKVEGA
ncbi:MAG: diguanylate cyclase [Oligoflexia bacterium]|nr:diguanylate cyclase [Oligoflexia bacterium]